MQSRAAHLRCPAVGGGDVGDVGAAAGAAAGAAMAIAICALTGGL